MAARPRSKKNAALPVNLYHYGGIYVYRRPTDGKRFSLGPARAKAIRLANEINARLLSSVQHQKERETVRTILAEAAPPTLSEVAERFKAEHLPQRDLAKATLSETTRRLKAISEVFIDRPADEITTREIADFLAQHPANTGNKYRTILIQLFRYGISEGLCDKNPAEVTLRARERVQRARLDLEAFRAILGVAEPWMRNAMLLGLHTLQRRGDLVRMRWDHIKDGHLLVEQQKVERHGTGRIAIVITPPLQAVIDACRDELVSPFLIHRRPQKLRGDYRQIKDHWTQIKPEMLSRAFQAARDEVGAYSDLPAEARPSFHEIRALGAWLYKQSGVDPQALLGHASARMTALYLKGGDKWTKVEGGLVL